MMVWSIRNFIVFFFLFLSFGQQMAAAEPINAPAPVIQPVSAHKDCSDCPPMVLVSIDVAGVKKELMVARHELTWKEYLFAYDRGKCPPPKNHGNSKADLVLNNLHDDYPMTAISPNDFQCYLSWMQKVTGNPYRLPSEVEWMAIAKKSSGRENLKIGEIPCGKANFPGFCQNSAGYSRADPNALYDPREAVRYFVEKVEMRQSDNLGLYDLFGNAGELVSDREIFLGYLKVNGVRQVENNSRFKGLNCLLTGQDKFDLIHDYCKYLSRDVRESSGFRIVYDRSGK